MRQKRILSQAEKLAREPLSYCRDRISLLFSAGGFVSDFDTGLLLSAGIGQENAGLNY